MLFSSSIPSGSSVFQVNFRESFYFIDSCLGSTHSKPNPIKLGDTKYAVLFLHFCVEMAAQSARMCCLGGQTHLHGEGPSGGAVVPGVSTALGSTASALVFILELTTR